VNSTKANVRPATCPPLPVQTLGTNFHTSYMPVVAAGCWGPNPLVPIYACESGQTVFNPATGTHVATVCDIGNGTCRTDGTAQQQTPVSPSQVVLDPKKRYFISILAMRAMGLQTAPVLRWWIQPARVACGNSTLRRIAHPARAVRISCHLPASADTVWAVPRSRPGSRPSTFCCSKRR
jgi:hypothetical protein